MEINSDQVDVETTDTLVSGLKNRNYSGIQNQDTTNFVVIKFNSVKNAGDAATLTNGVKLLPGEFYKIITNNMGEIRAIADTAQVKITLVEGV